MAIIKNPSRHPPSEKLVEQVLERPYDVLNSEEAREGS